MQQALHAESESGDVEVHEQPARQIRQLQVSQHLRNMHSMNLLDRLHFDDKLSFDHDVETERVADRLAAILNRDAVFLLKVESGEQQLYDESVTVGRLQQPRAKPPMHFDRATDDASTKSLQVFDIGFHDR